MLTEFFIHMWTAALCIIKHWCVQSRTYRINMLDSTNCRRSFQKGYLHSWENFLQVPRKAGDIDSWICGTHLNQCCCHCCVLPIPHWCQKCFHGCPCKWRDAPYYTCKQRTRMLSLRWQVEQTAERCGKDLMRGHIHFPLSFQSLFCLHFTLIPQSHPDPSVQDGSETISSETQHLGIPKYPESLYSRIAVPRTHTPHAF